MHKPTSPQMKDKKSNQPAPGSVHLLPDKGEIPAIPATTESRLYGYIMGLAIGIAWPDGHYDENCYVMFQWNNQQAMIWRVPDEKLFGLLARELSKSAAKRLEMPSSFRQARIHIYKAPDGFWEVWAEEPMEPWDPKIDLGRNEE